METQLAQFVAVVVGAALLLDTLLGWVWGEEQWNRLRVVAIIVLFAAGTLLAISS